MDIKQEDYDKLVASAKRAEKADSLVAQANQRVNEANKIVRGLQVVAKEDQNLANYIMAKSRGENVSNPYGKIDREDSEDLEPSERKVADLEAKIERLMGAFETYTHSARGENEDLKARLALMDLKGNGAPDFDKYKEEMSRLAEDAPEILRSKNALKILYDAASAKDKAKGEAEKVRQEQEQRVKDLQDAWSPPPTGLGGLDVSAENLDKAESIEDIIDALLPSGVDVTFE